MTTIPPVIRRLSERLRGIDPVLSYSISEFIPEWWDERLNNSPGAVQQLLLSICKSTNLDAQSAMNESAELCMKDIACCFKHAVNKTPEDLTAASGVIHSLATTVAAVTTTEYTSIPKAKKVRAAILDSGKPWVDLEALVDYCWQHGIPVLYVPKLPVSKKMDAVVTDINGRPVIVLTKKCKHASQLLFLLSHELGHIAHGDLTNGVSIIETAVENLADVDAQEKKATAFALKLLTGNAKTAFSSKSRRLTAANLAGAAQQIGAEEHIDPGHIALNWAHTTGHYPTGMQALNHLDPYLTWNAEINNLLRSNIDEDAVDDDQLDYLFRLVNIEY